MSVESLSMSYSLWRTWSEVLLLFVLLHKLGQAGFLVAVVGLFLAAGIHAQS